MAKKSIKVFHLSKDSRSRLLRLRNRLVWLLDEDRKFGFSEDNLSCKIAPELWSIVSLLWCKPLRAVSRSFVPVNMLDKPSVLIHTEVVERMEACFIHLDAENMRLRQKLGLKRDDDLPF